MLVSQGIIRGDEQIAGVQKVLGAAAWTYVTAAVSAIGVWLFYLFVVFFRGRAASARLSLAGHETQSAVTSPFEEHGGKQHNISML